MCVCLSHCLSFALSLRPASVIIHVPFYCMSLLQRYKISHWYLPERLPFSLRLSIQFTYGPPFRKVRLFLLHILDSLEPYKVFIP